MKITISHAAIVGWSLGLGASGALAQGTLQPVQSTLQQLVSTMTGPIATCMPATCMP